MPYIYVLSDPDKRAVGKYKVGHTTRDFLKRFKEYKTALPGVCLCFTVETQDSKLDEARIHQHLDSKYKRDGGEWFCAPSLDDLIRSILEVLYPDRAREPTPK